MRCRSKMASGLLILLGLFCLSNSQYTDIEEVKSVLELIELEYEDACKAKAEFQWNMLLGNKMKLDDKLDNDEKFGDNARSQMFEVKEMKTDDALLTRKLELISKPGDTLLETDQWNKLITYADNAEYSYQTAKDIDCHKNVPRGCTMSEYINFIQTSRDEDDLIRAKKSFNSKLPDETEFLTDILPLLKNASRSNGYNNLEKYWEMLVEYDGGYDMAKRIWSDIEPVYEKLQKYVAKKLEKKYESVSENKPLPTYLLGSLLGEDWLNLADIVVPNSEVYNLINKNLEQKQLGGKNAFKIASNTLLQIGLGELHDKFWRDSKFDLTCPIELVNYCQPNSLRASSCKDIKLSLFLDTYEAAFAVKHVQLKSLKMSNSYIFREGNRFSALDEAFRGMGSLIAIIANHHNPDGPFSLRLPDTEKNAQIQQIAFQFMMALRDFPRLAYYFSVDKWRLAALENSPSVNAGDLWVEAREKISHVSPSKNEYLADPHILNNKPYLGKFLGIILKYQIFESLTSDMYDKELPFSKLGQRAGKLRNMMEVGLVKKWPAVINELEIEDLSSTALLDYFQPLTDFLNAEVDEENPEENLIENIIDNEQEKEDSNIKDSDGESMKEVEHYEVISENIQKLEPKDEQPSNIKYESTTSDTKVIKEGDGGIPAASSSDLSNLNAPKNDEIDAASLQYAAIGIGVLLLLIVVLTVVIIARKRYKHKKELERERRHGAA